MNKFARFVPATRRNLGVALATLGASTMALAQSTDPFDIAVDGATTAIEGYGPQLVGLAAVGVVFMIAIKYVKKIRGAA